MPRPSVRRFARESPGPSPAPVLPGPPTRRKFGIRPYKAAGPIRHVELANGFFLSGESRQAARARSAHQPAGHLAIHFHFAARLGSITVLAHTEPVPRDRPHAPASQQRSQAVDRVEEIAACPIIDSSRLPPVCGRTRMLERGSRASRTRRASRCSGRAGAPGVSPVAAHRAISQLSELPPLSAIVTTPFRCSQIPLQPARRLGRPVYAAEAADVQLAKTSHILYNESHAYSGGSRRPERDSRHLWQAAHR